MLKFGILSLTELKKYKKYIRQETTATDFAVILGAEVSEKQHFDKKIPYINEKLQIENYSDRVASYFIEEVSKEGITKVNSNGMISYDTPLNSRVGIRPVIKYDDINDLVGLRPIEKLKDGMYIVEYGEYPSYAMPNKKEVIDYMIINPNKTPLECCYETIDMDLLIAINRKEANATGKKYNVNAISKYDPRVSNNTFRLLFSEPSIGNNRNISNFIEEKKIFEYIYNDKKFVAMLPAFNNTVYSLSNFVNYTSNDWIFLEVTPIRWLLDPKNKKLISEKVILSGIPYDYPDKILRINEEKRIYHYERTIFNDTLLCNYLNKVFAKDIIPSKLIQKKDNYSYVKRK